MRARTILVHGAMPCLAIKTSERLSLRHARGPQEMSGALGQSGRRALHQAKSHRQRKNCGVAALVAGAIADTPKADLAEQRPGVLRRLGVGTGVPNRLELHMLGQGLDVGRLQVVVGVLNDAPAEFTQRLLESPLELVRARRRNSLAAKVGDEVARSRCRAGAMTSVRSVASASASLPSAAAGVLDRRIVARVSSRCIEYGIRRPSVGAGFIAATKGRDAASFKTATTQRRFSQKTTQKQRFQAQQRDRTGAIRCLLAIRTFSCYIVSCAREG